MKVVFDSEADGLLQTANKLWMVVATVLSEDQKTLVFTDFTKDYYPLLEYRDFLDACKIVIGHNIMMYDLPLFEKLHGFRLKKTVERVDTFILSKVLEPRRFANRKHSLEDWGEFLGQPKTQHSDWSKASSEMLNRCLTDVELNVKVYNHLVDEIKAYPRPMRKMIRLGLDAEHSSAEFIGRSCMHGWPFDSESAKDFLNYLNSKMKPIEEMVNPHLRVRAKAIDGKEVTKEPTWTKNGNYTVNTVRHFGLDSSEGRKKILPIEGPFCRIEWLQPDIGSMEAVKEYLYELGWEPDDWNYKDLGGGQKVQTSPKLSESSLEPLGEIATNIGKYYSLRAKASILEGWLAAVEESGDGRIHGDVFILGTPTGRVTHKLLANVPVVEVEAESKEEKQKILETLPDCIKALRRGEKPELDLNSLKPFDALERYWNRSLFYAPKGYKIVGADSASNQNRGLCHFLKNEEYTLKVINSDIHLVNAGILHNIIPSLNPNSKKPAKPFFYALIFGGGDGKLSLILIGRRDPVLGGQLKAQFMAKIPGFERLSKEIKEVWTSTASKYGKENAYIRGLDYRKLYTNSPHRGLNYLLQNTEALTCKAAAGWASSRLDELCGNDWWPLLFNHDEIQVMIPEKHAEEAARICAQAFKEAPKLFGIEIMDGDSSIGINWAETH
jgi:hypothetical protein